MELLMEVKGLEKRYGGNQVLNGVNLMLEPGRIYGLLGPNGSGKTTILKIAAGLLQADKGEIVYPKGAQRGMQAKQTVSFLPDRTEFPSWMRVKDAFQYYRDAYPDYSREKAEYMAELLEIPQKAVLKKQSKGLQERVALALTFSRDTALYLLDEPLGGIDPVGKMKVLQSILSTQLENSAILLSTHLVRDVETVFDRVFFLRQGMIIYQEDCETIREQSGATVNDKYLEVFGNAYTM